MGDFVGMCLTKEVNVPIKARTRLASLLDKLCTQYDRRLDDDDPDLLNREDLYTEAINTTRGHTLKRLINFGEWVRRHDDSGDVPEVRAIIEKRFSSDAEYPLTIPEHAILGRLYWWIFHLDEEWAITRKSDFFPKNNLRAWWEAFGNFLRYSDPNRPIYNELDVNFEFSLDHLDQLKQQIAFWEKSAHEFLGHHLFTYYLWKVYPLKGENSLLERYYQKTGSDRERWATLFSYIGRGLRNTKRLDSSFKERILAFFEWRLEVGEPSELQKFVNWLEAECLEAEWRLNAYSRILDLLQKRGVDQWTNLSAPMSFHAIHSMRKMLPMATGGVVECFAKLTDSMRGGVVYLRIGDSKAILSAGLDHEEEKVREIAREARENLLRSGYLSVMDSDN